MESKKKYAVAGILALSLLLFAAVYLSGGAKPLMDKIKSAAGPGLGLQSNEDAGTQANDPYLDDVVQKLKNDANYKNRTIVKSSGGGGVGGGGAGCRNEVSGSAATSADYFIKARVTGTENKVDASSGETFTYTYMEVSEYDKITGTAMKRDNESNLLVTSANITQAEYDAERAKIPDLAPENLLIVSPADSGEGSPPPDIINLFLKYESGGFTVVC